LANVNVLPELMIDPRSRNPAYREFLGDMQATLATQTKLPVLVFDPS
jgi:hypothetical protein